MRKATSSSALKIQAVLGNEFDVLEFSESTRTAEEAAAAIGCSVAQIAKSLLFRATESDRPILVVASGTNRVDEKKVAALIGEGIARADADFVRSKTGFAIGGVPPVGHLEPPIILIDADINCFDIIWAAAGTPNAVFKLTPAQLHALTQGQVADVAKR
ncbi:MAG TPA: YbaK/EbsC family protein [Dongiaceae bacterium]|nr:YbaK/EbsC family protein [Dongiaceae bacterium]